MKANRSFLWKRSATAKGWVARLLLKFLMGCALGFGLDRVRGQLSDPWFGTISSHGLVCFAVLAALPFICMPSFLPCEAPRRVVAGCFSGVIASCILLTFFYHGRNVGM